MMIVTNRRQLVNILLAVTVWLLFSMSIAKANEGPSADYIYIMGNSALITGDFPADPNKVTFEIIEMNESTVVSSLTIETFSLMEGRYYGTGFIIEDYQHFMDRIHNGNIRLLMTMHSDNSSSFSGTLRWGIHPDGSNGGELIIVDPD